VAGRLALDHAVAVGDLQLAARVLGAAQARQLVFLGRDVLLFLRLGLGLGLRFGLRLSLGLGLCRRLGVRVLPDVLAPLLLRLLVQAEPRLVEAVAHEPSGSKRRSWW